MSGSSSSRYLLGLAAGALVSFGLIWAYVLARPEAFLESGYPIWEAKQSFISRCDMGAAMISGDSRAEAAVDPRGLDIPTRNISFGAETPLEGYFFTRRAMACPTPPRQVVITFSPPDFTSVSQFLWENGARFGFIHYDELSEISAAARDLHDPSVEAVQSRLGFGGALRNWLYAVHFPPLYFNALLTGQVFRRQAANHAVFETARAGLGHVAYFRHGAAPPFAGPAVITGDFRPAPVQTAFFDRTLAMLAARKVEVTYMPMPVSESMARQASKAGMREFENYLSGFARRYPNFHIVTPLMVTWPDEAFLDGVHMEASYANRFSGRVKACQDAALKSAGPVLTCDLSWQSVSGLARR
jgi:hypothetical protein